MRVRILTKWVVTFAAAVTLPASSLRAQESPAADESFEVEPPLLVPPGDLGEGAHDAPETPPSPAKLAQQLEQAKRSASSAERLVRMGALAKVEAEQRALRVDRLEAALANAQMAGANEEVTLLQARDAAGQASKADLEVARATLSKASIAAQTADEKYHQAQLDAAALNLRRQKRLLAQGSARKSDVARAEEKLGAVQRGEQ